MASATLSLQRRQRLRPWLGSGISYPRHPDVLETFTSKTATLVNFQASAGMLRILSRTVSRLWALKPSCSRRCCC